MPVFIVSKEYIRDLAAGEYTKQNGGKPWKYVLLSEDDFDRTHQLRYVLAKCGVE